MEKAKKWALVIITYDFDILEVRFKSLIGYKGNKRPSFPASVDENVENLIFEFADKFIHENYEINDFIIHESPFPSFYNMSNIKRGDEDVFTATLRNFIEDVENKFLRENTRDSLLLESLCIIILNENNEKIYEDLTFSYTVLPF